MGAYSDGVLTGVIYAMLRPTIKEISPIVICMFLNYINIQPE